MVLTNTANQKKLEKKPKALDFLLTFSLVLYIDSGRHLLQEMCLETNFIPNDTSLAFDILQ